MSDAGPSVPVIRQVDPGECGPACLAMVLQAHGIPGSLKDCRRYLRPGARGVDATSLAATARRFGLKVRAFSADGQEAFEALPLPAVLHWRHETGEDHFVVLEGWSKSKAVVVDPARGRRRLPWSHFLRLASGVALTLQPGGEPSIELEERQSSAQVFRRVLALPGVAAAFGRCSVMAGILALIVSWADLWIRPVMPPTIRDGPTFTAGMALALGVVVATARLRVVGRATLRLEKALASRSVLGQLPASFRPQALVEPSTSVDSWLGAKIRRLIVRLISGLTFDFVAAFFAITVLAFRAPVVALTVSIALVLLAVAVVKPISTVSTHRLGQISARERPSVRATELLDCLLATSPRGRLGRAAWTAFAAWVVLWGPSGGEYGPWVFITAAFSLICGWSAGESWRRLRYVPAGFVSLELASAAADESRRTQSPARTTPALGRPPSQ